MMVMEKNILFKTEIARNKARKNPDVAAFIVDIKLLAPKSDVSYFNEKYKKTNRSDVEGYFLALNIPELVQLSTYATNKELKSLADENIYYEIKRVFGMMHYANRTAQNSLKNYIRNAVNIGLSYVEEVHADNNKTRSFKYNSSDKLFDLKLTEHNYPYAIDFGAFTVEETNNDKEFRHEIKFSAEYKNKLNDISSFKCNQDGSSILGFQPTKINKKPKIK